MKKLLMSVLLSFGLCLPCRGMAADDKMCITWLEQVGGYKGPRGAIYFKNDSSEISSECTNAVNALVADLEQLADSISSIVLVGSTDRTGSNTYNDDLSKKRVDTVFNRLKQSSKLASKLCNHDGCLQRLNVGENIHANYGAADSTAESTARAVFIYLLYEQLTCTSELRGLLDKVLSASFKDTSECGTAKTNLETAANKCTAGAALSIDNHNQIMDALNAVVPCINDITVLNEITNTIKITFNLTDVSDAYNRLQQMRRDFDVTVWKTADGKFNTSRLISDSVAGVVLGTTGALVTSKLVKKSQIKKGFEDIQCTIGGQAVANWDDEFVVGIQ